MATLDSILGKFEAVKNELAGFISDSKLDRADLEERNEELRHQISDNVDTMNQKDRDIKRAQRSIKQINKLMGA